MLKYIVKRLGYLILVLIGVSFIVFSLLYITPGDPASMMLGEAASPEAKEQLREQLGLNDPFLVRYFNYMKDIIIHQDMGSSYVGKEPVIDEILRVFPNTLKLSLSAMIFASATGLVLGIISAVKQYSIIDNLVMVLALIGNSVPMFWIGLLMILFFSVKLGWFPSSGYDTPLHMVMPAIVLGMQSTSVIARMTRSSMLEVIRQDFVKTAQAKGQVEIVVIIRHIFGNALIPIITIIGLQFGSLLGGAILTETIFSIQGIGRLMVESIRTREYLVVQGSVLFIAACFSLVNLAVDILYVFVDPKITKV